MTGTFLTVLTFLVLHTLATRRSIHFSFIEYIRKSKQLKLCFHVLVSLFANAGAVVKVLKFKKHL